MSGSIEAYSRVRLILREESRIMLTLRISGTELNSCKGMSVSFSHAHLSIRHNIAITVVFDGAPLPSKRDTEVSRQKAREDSLNRARELEAAGDLNQAYAFYSKSVDVSPDMAFRVAQAIKPMGVQVLVAPYEADAQLAYLSRNNMVDFIISEDSDLLVYGCSRVLYKFDFKTEKGREIVRSNIFEIHPDFSRMTTNSFLFTCVLSGCDYLPSLNQIGVRKASSIGARLEHFLTPSVPLDSAVNRVITLLKLSNFDPDDIDDFPNQLLRAILTFQHQTVFCPIQRALIPLTPISHPIDNPNFLGEIYEQGIAQKVAECSLHPETKHPFFHDRIENSTQPESRSSGTQKSSKNRTKKINLPKLKSSVEKDIRKPLTLISCWSSRTTLMEANISPKQISLEDNSKFSPVSVVSLSSECESPSKPPPFKITRIQKPSTEVLDLDKFSLEQYASEGN